MNAMNSHLQFMFAVIILHMTSHLYVHACSQSIVVAERERSAEAVRAAVEEERR